MKRIFQDFIKSLFWATVVYVCILFAAPSITEFIRQKEHLIALIVLLSSPCIFTGNSFASIAQRVAKTYSAIGYQSLSIVNGALGVLAGFFAMRTFLWEEKIDTASNLLGLVIFLSICSTLVNSVPIKKVAVRNLNNCADLLGRKKFVNKAVLLLQEPAKLTSKSKDEALIIWLASGWGTGKSWTLAEIQNSFLQNRDRRKLIWYSFNPWLHSSSEPEQDLVKAFFSGLSEEISKHFYLEGLNSDILDYSKSILSQSSQRILGVDVEKFLSRHETTEDLKRQISEFLVASNIQMVMTFDEIDRLTPEEMVTCLKLIRSLANFANTTILVCGAPDKVEDLLEDADLPQDYLEKIAQVPLSLPRIDLNKLLDILWHYLDGDKLDGENKTSVSNAIANLRLNASNYGSLKNDQTSLLNNLRTIERLADAIKLDFLYQDRSADIDCLDFINLQLIRLNCFPLYEAIKNNKPMWVGDRPSDGEETSKATEELEDIVSEALKRSGGTKAKVALKKLLKQMFPVYRDGLRDFVYREHENKTPICREDFFDRYFVEGLPDGQVSLKVIKSLIRDWDGGAIIKDTFSTFQPSDIVWVIRELATTKPVELKPKIKKALIKFLIDEQLDGNTEYIAHGFKAEPQDFLLPGAKDYQEIVDYYFSKTTKVDNRFFEACDYVNKLYWKQKRSGIDGVTAQDIKKLVLKAQNAFKQLLLNKGKDPLSLPDREFHYYWRVLGRDDLNFTKVLRKSIKSKIESDPHNFCRYLYVYREAGHGERETFRNNYDTAIGFTSENIELAKKHLNSNNLADDDRKDLDAFLTIAQKHKQD